MKKHVEKHLTLREKILETIRDAIIAGALKPGEKVAEPELAERFGISRTPIREAFRQLESEGYLTVIPRKGAVVVSFSEKDVEEFYAIKSILEGYAARRACENLTPRELERLQTINGKLLHLADDGDFKGFFKMHNDFHEQFIRAADNEKLYDLIMKAAGPQERRIRRQGPDAEHRGEPPAETCRKNRGPTYGPVASCDSWRRFA